MLRQTHLIVGRANVHTAVNESQRSRLVILIVQRYETEGGRDLRLETASMPNER